MSKGFQPLALAGSPSRTPSGTPAPAPRRRPLFRLFLLLKTAAVLLWALWPSQNGPAVLLNISASEPVGLYRRLEREPARGALVAACLPVPWAKLALERRYLSRGRRCQSGAVPVLKTVAAVEGDVIGYEAGALTVNGERIPHSAIRAEDRQGRPMPHALAYPYRLAAGEVLLLAEHDGSFDGRYSGPTAPADVLGVYAPLLTRGGGGRDD